MDEKDDSKTEESKEPEFGDFAKKKGEVVLREHEFDGIREFDQKLPNWWLITLYVAIAWAGIHWFVYYHTGAMQTDAERMEEWQEANKEAKAAALEKMLNNLSDDILINDWSTDPDVLAKGEAKYKTTCVGCHAPDMTSKIGGVQLTGLSLVDGEWKYGGTPMDIFKIINEGSPPESTGLNGVKMVPWSQNGVTLEEIAQLTAFIISKNREEFPINN